MSNLAIPKINDLESNAAEAADLLAAMSNRRRLMILCRLLEGETQAGDLADICGLSQSALSQHLAKLREAGLVSTRREAQMIHYRLSSPPAEAVLATLYRIYCA
ncbi:MAG TPA: metalloregulator ArsR/SmtB family transcription factor [Afifellaceae bacterium]|nr:metalloregulator ArsR/SmtB family transcription factor [Afifellaceae bacterium]